MTPMTSKMHAGIEICTHHCVLAETQRYIPVSTPSHLLVFFEVLLYYNFFSFFSSPLQEFPS
jgi:hypothetical protein